MDTIKLTADEFWLYLRVACLILLILAFAINWARKSEIAKAYKITGLATLFVLTCMLVVISFDNAHAYVFGPLFSLALAAWFALDDWYFHNYPNYENWLKEPDRPLGTFGLNTWLGRKLSERDDIEPEANSMPILCWRNASCVLAILLVFSLFFGFARVLDKLVLFSRVSLKTQVVADTKYRTIITSQRIQDSLAALGRDSIKAALAEKNIKDSLWQAYVRANFKAQLAGIAAVKKVAKTATVTRPVLIYNSTTRPFSAVPGPRLNREVTVPEPARTEPRRIRSRKTTLLVQHATDSTYASNGSLGHPESDTSLFARRLIPLKP